MKVPKVRLRKFNPEQTTLQVTVEVTKEFRARMWLGLLLIRCAGRIIGIGIEVNSAVVKP